MRMHLAPLLVALQDACADMHCILEWHASGELTVPLALSENLVGFIQV